MTRQSREQISQLPAWGSGLHLLPGAFPPTVRRWSPADDGRAASAVPQRVLVRSVAPANLFGDHEPTPAKGRAIDWGIQVAPPHDAGTAE